MKVIKIRSCLSCPYLRSSFNKAELKCVRDVHSLKTIKIDPKKFKIPAGCNLHDVAECTTCAIKLKRDKLWRWIEILYFVTIAIVLSIIT